jgi:phosphatidylserine decarboxylase
MNEESPNGWFSPEAKKQIDYDLYICDPTKPHYGFKNWNNWFIREFKLGARPLAQNAPNTLR